MAPTLDLADPIASPPLRPIRGRNLRYALSLHLLRAGELTIPALVELLQQDGFRIDGRASKTVSDALRWEVGHDRVVRVGRGRYRRGRIPRSTVWWMLRTLERARAAWDELPLAARTAPATSGPAAVEPATPRWAPAPRAFARGILTRMVRNGHRPGGRTTARRRPGPPAPWCPLLT